MGRSSSAQASPDGTTGSRSRLAACAALSGALALSLVACRGGETGERTAAPASSSAAEPPLISQASEKASGRLRVFPRGLHP